MLFYQAKETPWKEKLTHEELVLLEACLIKEEDKHKLRIGWHKGEVWAPDSTSPLHAKTCFK